MAVPNVYEVVGRYLHGDIPEVELRRWLLGCVDWLERWAPEDQRDFGYTAMNFDFILQSGEWTEEIFRRALDREHRKALKQRPSPVS